jgi:hypothetical protein
MRSLLDATTNLGHILDGKARRTRYAGECLCSGGQLKGFGFHSAPTAETTGLLDLGGKVLDPYHDPLLLRNGGEGDLKVEDMLRSYGCVICCTSGFDLIF